MATKLDAGFSATRDALASGAINAKQAAVIVRAVEALPDPVDEGVRQRAEKELLSAAAEHDAKALRILGRRVFEAVDPDAADLEEGRRLEREEASAARPTFLQVFDNSDGTHTGRFKIPNSHAEMLRKVLNVLTSPAAQRRNGLRAEGGRKVTRPELLGQGLCDLLERLPECSRRPEASRHPSWS